MNISQPSSKSEMRNRAGTSLSLRIIACGYLIYLGCTVVRDLLNGSSTLPPFLGWASAVVFVGAGLGFGFYAWKQYHKQLAAAETAEGAEEAPADGAETSNSGGDTP